VEHSDERIPESDLFFVLQPISVLIAFPVTGSK
jgi:hypothetical protein